MNNNMKIIESTKKRPDNLDKLLEIKNSTDTSADLYFYGDIVSSSWGAWEEEDQYPLAIQNFLKGQEGKDLNIYVNSGGGSVFAGMAIYNMLKRHTGFKTVRVDGVAASIASIIALAGDKIIIPDNAFFMIHKPWSSCYGANADEMREQADLLDKIEETALKIYEENLKNPDDIEKIKQLMQEETWLTGSEAAKYFNIEVVDSVEAVAYSGEILDKYMKTPAKISKDNEKASNNSIEVKKINILNRLEKLGGKN